MDSSESETEEAAAVARKVRVAEMALMNEALINNQLVAQVQALEAASKDQQAQARAAQAATPQDPVAAAAHARNNEAVQAVLDERLAHFKLDHDDYNTHFHECQHDRILAVQGLLRAPDKPRGEHVFLVSQGANVRRLFLFAATGGAAALLPGTRVGELRIQTDEITGAELVSLFGSAKAQAQPFTLNTLKDHIRSRRDLRVVEYCYQSPRHANVPLGLFSIYIELAVVSTHLTTAPKPSGGVTAAGGSSSSRGNDGIGGGGGGGVGGDSGGPDGDEASRIREHLSMMCPAPPNEQATNDANWPHHVYESTESLARSDTEMSLTGGAVVGHRRRYGDEFKL